MPSNHLFKYIIQFLFFILILINYDSYIEMSIHAILQCLLIISFKFNFLVWEVSLHYMQVKCPKGCWSFELIYITSWSFFVFLLFVRSSVFASSVPLTVTSWMLIWWISSSSSSECPSVFPFVWKDKPRLSDASESGEFSANLVSL